MRLKAKRNPLEYAPRHGNSPGNPHAIWRASTYLPAGGKRACCTVGSGSWYVCTSVTPRAAGITFQAPDEVRSLVDVMVPAARIAPAQQFPSRFETEARICIQIVSVIPILFALHRLILSLTLPPAAVCRHFCVYLHLVYGILYRKSPQYPADAGGNLLLAF